MFPHCVTCHTPGRYTFVKVSLTEISKAYSRRGNCPEMHGACLLQIFFFRFENICINNKATGDADSNLNNKFNVPYIPYTRSLQAVCPHFGYDPITGNHVWNFSLFI